GGHRCDREIAPRAIDHVRQNPVGPVCLEGQVAVRAGILQGTDSCAVPEAAYAALDVNGQTVPIDSESNRICA
ncbi:MAG: hypothetical protein ACLFPZ_13015, partial [Rhodosalinus sp.]